MKGRRRPLQFGPNNGPCIDRPIKEGTFDGQGRLLPRAGTMCAATVADGVELLLAAAVDLVLLDCVLPGETMWQIVLKADRQQQDIGRTESQALPERRGGPYAIGHDEHEAAEHALGRLPDRQCIGSFARPARFARRSRNEPRELPCVSATRAME
jgi:hypothetical protein